MSIPQTGWSAADRYLYTLIKLLKAAAGEATPVGIIAMWSGGTVPKGWALCDGTNGTPNLADKFIKGSGTGVAVGSTGGGKTHTHPDHSFTPAGAVSQPSFTGNALPTHQHELPIQFAAGKIRKVEASPPFGAGASYTSTEEASSAAAAVSAPVALSGPTSAGTPSGTVSQPTFTGAAATIAHTAANHEPQFYALAFIMKV